MKRKFTDMVPVIVGRLTLRADAMAATKRKHSARVRFCGLHWLRPMMETSVPAAQTAPIYSLALTGIAWYFSSTGLDECNRCTNASIFLRIVVSQSVCYS